MLTIYKGNTYRDCAEYVFKRLAQLDKTRLDVKHFVLVPDRASLEAENLMLSRLGGSFSIQVLTVNRLFSRLTSKSDGRYLPKQSALIALSGIIADKRDKFVCFKKGVDTVGFCQNVYDTVCAFRYCKISPRQLERDDYPPALKGKMKDLALIYGEYEKFLQSGYVDSAARLDALCAALPTLDDVKNGFFYFYDFDNFSAQEIALIETLTHCARGVTVMCCCSDKERDKYLYLNDIYADLVAMCQRAGISPVVVSGESHLNKYTAQIGNNLYRYGSVAPIRNDGFLTLFSGETRVQEVYALACKISKYVRAGGRYKDVYVVTSDITKYANAVSLVFTELGIPYFLDIKSNLAQHVYCSFLTDFLSAVKNRSISNVLNFAKNCLYTDDVLAVSRFENYCTKYNVKYGFGELKLGKDDDCFDETQAFAKRLRDTFEANVFTACESVESYVEKTKRLIDNVKLGERLADFLVRQQQNGRYYAGVTAQVEKKTDDCLNEILLLASSRVVKLDEYLSLLSAALSAVDVSVVPTKCDAVVFANMAKARKHDIGFLALLGANQGEMPLVKREGSLLNDKNISEMEKMGLPLAPRAAVENKRERFSLFQLLQEAESQLMVCCTESDSQGSILPSSFVDMLKKEFSENGEDVKFAKPDQNVYSQRQAVAKIVANKRRVADGLPVNMDTFSALSEKFSNEANVFDFSGTFDKRISCGGKLFLQKEASVTKITDFCSCPYKFFFRYGLKVKKLQKAQLDSDVLGDVLHSVLERYVKKFDKTKDETDDETNAAAAKIFGYVMQDDFLRGLAQDESMQRIISELKVEAQKMCREVKRQMRESNFVNFGAEIEFGLGKELPPVEVKFDGGSFLLRGKIDRVDVCDNDFFVIDYKSGSKSSSARFDESKFYAGDKLQLLVYLVAMTNGKRMRPVGFYYFALHNEFDKKEKTSFDFCGRTLNDLSVAQSIDRTLSEGESKRLHLKLKANGELSSTTALLTENQIKAFMRYAETFVGKCGEQMLSGYVAANPEEGVCDYCDYASVCDFGDIYTNPARKEIRGIKRETIENIKYE